MDEISISAAEMRGNAPGAEPKRRGNQSTRVPEILEVSIRVFATEGSAGYSLRRVAQEAGIRLRTLQHYFSTREELLRRTIKELGRRYLDVYLPISKDRQLSPEERLEKVLDTAFAALTGPDSILSTFAIESWCLAEHEEFVNQIMREVIDEFQAMFADLVAKISPTLTARECELRGALLLSQWQGTMVFTRRAGDRAPEKEALLLAMKAVWRAVSTSK